MQYRFADGSDLLAVYESAEELAEYVREQRRPAILHLRAVRFGGHAGTDVESSYRSAASIRPDRDADPIVATARLLVASGVVSADQLVERVLSHAADVGRVVVVDETRRQGGVGEAIVTTLVQGGFAGPITRVAGRDSFIPLGDAANLVLVSEDDIADAVRSIRKR